MFRVWAGAAELAERASPSSRQDVRPSPSKGQREPCPAKATRASGPATRASSTFSTKRVRRAGTFGHRRRIAPTAEVSPTSPRGAPVASNKDAQGIRKWGPKTLGGRVAGARAQEGAGGAASCSAGRAGRGVDRPPADCRRPAAFADMRA